MHRLNIRNLHDIRLPLIRTNCIGMVWISDVQWISAQEPLIHVMGPAFVDHFSIAKIEAQLDHLHLSLPLKRHFLDMINELPIVQVQTFLQYAVMFHYSITGERISMNELFSSVSDSFSKAENMPAAPESHRSGDYMLEQQLLSCVREGNLSYQTSMDRLSSFSKHSNSIDQDYLRHIKNMQIIFTALCTRAAIEGGLSPDSAYLLSDHYIRQIECTDSLSALGNIGQSMLDDFIKKVHRLKCNRVSPPVQQICDYIQLLRRTNLTCTIWLNIWDIPITISQRNSNRKQAARSPNILPRKKWSAQNSC